MFHVPALQPALSSDVCKIRNLNPVIHNVTNQVVMNITANMLLALGASPIMAHASQELADIIALAHALVINIGTLDSVWLHSAKKAQALALETNRPIVFDPVGAGASVYRTDVALSLLASGVSVLRGNASEIMALAGACVQSSGVDSRQSSQEACNAAKHLSNKYGCCVVVSGLVDLVCQQERVQFIRGGTPMLTKITGMGCSSAALIAAFLAVNRNCLQASVHAVTLLNAVAEEAEKASCGPGSCQQKLLDALYHFK